MQPHPIAAVRPLIRALPIRMTKVAMRISSQGMSARNDEETNVTTIAWIIFEKRTKSRALFCILSATSNTKKPLIERRRSGWIEGHLCPLVCSESIFDYRIASRYEGFVFLPVASEVHSVRFQPVSGATPPATQPARSSPPAVEDGSPAVTATSSPEPNFSARPSIVLGNGATTGSPSSYRFAVGGETSPPPPDSGREDSQHRLLQSPRSEPGELEAAGKAQNVAVPAANAGPVRSPVVHFKQRAPTFSMGKSRMLQSMVTLKKMTP